MIDFLFGLACAAVIGRGYQRGVRREAFDLGVLMVAVFVAFRLSESAGDWLGRTGIGDLGARLVTGSMLFVLVMGLGYLIGRMRTRRLGEPHLVWTERLGGVAVGVVWLAVLSSVLILVVAALPLADRSRGVLASSRVVDAITAENSLAHGVVRYVGGTRVIESLLNLERFVGGEQIIVDPDGRVQLPDTGSGSIDLAESEADQIFELVNRARVEVGENPLAWSEGLAEVAIGHARELYEEGYFAHESPRTGSVAARVAAAGIPVVVVGENLGLAATPGQVHDGLMASPTHRQNILESRFRRVGVGAFQGPIGLLVVQVFSG